MRVHTPLPREGFPEGDFTSMSAEKQFGSLLGSNLQLGTFGYSPARLREDHYHNRSAGSGYNPGGPTDDIESVIDSLKSLDVVMSTHFIAGAADTVELGILRKCYVIVRSATILLYLRADRTFPAPTHWWASVRQANGSQ
jgi:hypothetical protein